MPETKETDYNGPSERWHHSFEGVKADFLEQGLVAWMRLFRQTADLQALTAGLNGDFSEVRQEVESARRALDFDRPYRLAVIGEGGAGKSTLINALLGRDLLKSDAGGPVTGTSVHVHSIEGLEKEEGSVVYRDEAEFLILLQYIARRFGLQSPKALEDADRMLASGELLNEIEAKAMPPAEKRQVKEDFLGIIKSWKNLGTGSRLGKTVTYDLGISPEKLKQFADEGLGSAEAEISGIARVEYRIRAVQGAERLRNTVLIDTPGIGAPNPRHREILQIETEMADAVILVLNANRPGAAADDMAELLNDVLFKGLVPEERERFLAKVFVVANRAESVQTEESQQRLRASIARLLTILAPGMAAALNGNLVGKNFVKTVAVTSLLAQKKLNHQKLSKEEEKILSSHLVLEGVAADAPQDEVLRRAQELSGVPEVQGRIREFLGEKRIELMLAEGDLRIKKAVALLRREAERILRTRGLSSASDDEASVSAERILREISHRQLEQERKELAAVFENLRAQLFAWRSSNDHLQRLTRTAEKVKQSLEGLLCDLLRSILAGDDGFVAAAVDDVSGRRVEEIHSRGLLLALEREVRRKLEEASLDFADYYLGQLEGLLASPRIHGAIKRACHGQAYLEEGGKPATQLEERRQAIRREFREICRWVLLAELLRHPIFPSRREGSNSKVREVAGNLSADFVEAGIEVLAWMIGWPAGLGGFGKKVFEEALKGGSGGGREKAGQPVLRTVDPQTQEGELVEKLSSLQLAGKTDDLRAAILQEFRSRLDPSLAWALASVEDLFFYEVGKLKRAFDSIVESIYEEHEARLRVGDEALGKALKDEHGSEWREVLNASSILAGIRHLESLVN
ncbi:MAG TPA: dynamin family protein [Thermoanaerobaculia bacterium]|nr:dynamin family protein [Thermoanaerobaculia bacterium]